MLGALLGGLAGILFPAAGAAAGGAAATGIGALLARAALPALGAGLGTLATGGSGKDAIRNALLMGGGAAAFPGLVSGIQNSGFGKGITGGLADIFGMGQGPTQQEPAAPSMSTSGVRPQPRPAGLGAMPEAPVVANLGPSGMEMEIQGRRPPSVLPTISEMVGIDQARSKAQAAADFDQIQALPYNMVRPEGLEVPYNMPRPEGLEVIGMQMEQPTVNESLRRYLNAEDNLRKPDLAIDYLLANRAAGPAISEGRLSRRKLLPRGYAEGGEIAGPGTGTSDSIPATIYQDGKPVRKAALSDGEFVMTADAVKGAGNGSRERGITRMYELMRRFERGEMA
jgi:hypothetical protein